MGNPHAIFFVRDAAAIDLKGLGLQIEQATRSSPSGSMCPR